eukprot:6198838-Pleurochrysis_carterae.AAC.1
MTCGVSIFAFDERARKDARPRVSSVREQNKERRERDERGTKEGRKREVRRLIEHSKMTEREDRVRIVRRW